MDRVTLQEFRLADLHTVSATVRHGSETLGSRVRRTHATEDCIKRLVLLLQQPPPVRPGSMIAAVRKGNATLMPTASGRPASQTCQRVSDTAATGGRAAASIYGTRSVCTASLLCHLTAVWRRARRSRITTRTHARALVSSPIRSRSSGTQEPQLVPACSRCPISSGERRPNSSMA